MIPAKHIRVLKGIAQEVAPHLVAGAWMPTEAAAKKLAYELARHDQLVLIGYTPATLPEPQRSAVISEWVENYRTLFKVIAESLFSSLAAHEHRIAYDNQYVILRISSRASDALAVIAGFIAPYVHSRQSIPNGVRPQEIEMLLSEIIYELEAQNAPPDKRRPIMDSGQVLITHLIENRIRQVPLTDFKRKVVPELAPPAPPAPQQAKPQMPPKPAPAPAAAPAPPPPPPADSIPQPDIIEDEDQSTSGLVLRLVPPPDNTKPPKTLPVRPPPPRDKKKPSDR